MSSHRPYAPIALTRALAIALAAAMASCGQEPPRTEQGEAPRASEGTNPKVDPEPERTQLGDGFAEGIELAAYPPLEIPSGSPKVLFVGDSITAGLHLPPDQAWPAALQRSLFADGVPFNLQNAGVSGDTTAGGLNRMDWLLKGAPDFVVIELGANDGLRAIDLANTDSNLRAIIMKAQAAGAQPILMGMDVPTNLGEYAQDFSAIYPRLAEAFNIPLVPGFLEGVGGHPDMNLKDGLHPTPIGHDRLAENAKSALKSALTGGRAEGL